MVAVFGVMALLLQISSGSLLAGPWETVSTEVATVFVAIVFFCFAAGFLGLYIRGRG